MSYWYVTRRPPIGSDGTFFTSLAVGWAHSSPSGRSSSSPADRLRPPVCQAEPDSNSFRELGRVRGGMGGVGRENMGESTDMIERADVSCLLRCQCAGGRLLPNETGLGSEDEEEGPSNL